MFVCTLKASTLKFFGVLLLCTAVLVTLIAWIPTYEAPYISTAYTDGKNLSFDKITDNASRIRFLSQFGWQVEETPADTASVVIPAEFDKVFTDYNTVQQLQGLDLSDYRRRSATRYTYIVTNYPNHKGKVYANLLVYRDRVIGGDICSADINGFLHGFLPPTGTT